MFSLVFSSLNQYVNLIGLNMRPAISQRVSAKQPPVYNILQKADNKIINLLSYLFYTKVSYLCHSVVI